MLFYIFTMVVMTIIVAFILEAFLFRIQYKQKMNKHEEKKKLSVVVKVTKEELFQLDELNTQAGRPDLKQLINEFFKFEEVINQGGVEFCGTKRRTKEELEKLMYKEEADNWLEEARQEEEKMS